jgi:hypothetical protein
MGPPELRGESDENRRWPSRRGDGSYDAVTDVATTHIHWGYQVSFLGGCLAAGEAEVGCTDIFDKSTVRGEHGALLSVTLPQFWIALQLLSWILNCRLPPPMTTKLAVYPTK